MKLRTERRFASRGCVVTGISPQGVNITSDHPIPPALPLRLVRVSLGPSVGAIAPHLIFTHYSLPAGYKKARTLSGERPGLKNT